MRVAHLVIVPAIGMALLLGAFRALDPLVGESLGPVGLEVYQAARTVLIALSMSGLIAFLAFRYRRAYETRLVERERLAAIGELAATVAHEVRNPLAGIRGGCEILLEGCPPGEARFEIGHEVLHQVDRLNRTVEDLLQFARPRAADPLPTDLHGLLDRLLAVVREDPSYRSVEIRTSYGPRLPVVRVDARQMEQVFLNLLHNACQAMRHRGLVTVATRAREGAVEVTVRDQGPGIPPESLERIFQPFYTTRSQGTGLGLAICRRIVESHAGRIEASCPPEGGAEFTVVLPEAA
jgi:signal transduction histidine kinase